MAAQADKSGEAFRTIGELSADLDIPQHILRYWETRFPQLRPLQRAGNRRYYRPADVTLVRRIDQLLNREGYTIKGVQKLLISGDREEAPAPAVATPASPGGPAPKLPDAVRAELRAIRDDLARALAEDS